MQIIKEVDKENPIHCDECERTVKTTYLIKGENQEGGMGGGILLCNICMGKFKKGKLDYSERVYNSLFDGLK